MFTARDVSHHVSDSPSQRDCLNYIRVLQVVDDQRLYACGTHAFQPQCDYLVGPLPPGITRANALRVLGRVGSKSI